MKEGKIILLGVLILFLIPATQAAGIAPARYERDYTPSTTVTLGYWAVNMNSEAENYTIGKGGALEDYIEPNVSKVTVPAYSLRAFNVNVTYPAYLSPGRHDSYVSVLHCSGGGGIGACVEAASQLWVYSYEPMFISDCTEINYNQYTSKYILNKSITTNNNTCIDINASDISFDCNGYSITGSNAADSKAIFADSVQNISITNCELSDWHHGIYLNNIDLGALSNNNVHNGFYLNSTDNLNFSNTILDNTNIDFSYKGDFIVSGVSNPPSDPTGFKNINKYVNITAQNPGAWFVLNISYDDADINNINDESTLRIFRYNSTNWAQVSDINSVNITENYVYANITNFSVFAPLGAPKLTDKGTSAKARPTGGYNLTPETLAENVTEVENKTKVLVTVSAPEIIEKPSCFCEGPTEWTECINGTQTRTVHRCSPDTDYICKDYEEKRSCTTPEELAGKALAFSAFGLAGVAGCVAPYSFWKQQSVRKKPKKRRKRTRKRSKK